jgi:16S rRNA (guanine966-N2)-methyltransferase
MRIVAGSARGRPLQGPKKADRIRPTADRVRESLFNVLGQWMDGMAVLDLYAGTGALALEALSRRAASALLVDSDREAQGLCRENAEALGLAGRVEVWPMPADRAIDKLVAEARRFDLIFADPPYGAKVAASLAGKVGALLAPEGRFCVEHDKREEAPERVAGVCRIDQRLFGDTAVSIYAPE